MDYHIGLNQLLFIGLEFYACKLHLNYTLWAYVQWFAADANPL